MEPSLEERRENEMSVLSSMYASDCVDQRDRDVWRVPRAPELKLRVTPSIHESRGLELRDDSKHITLHVDMGNAYPLKRPQHVALEWNDTLDASEFKTLKVVVEEMVRELEGDEMIMQLAQTISDHLAASVLKSLEEKKRKEEVTFDSEHDAMMARTNQHRIKEQTRLREAAAVESAADRAHRQAVREEVEQRLQQLREEEEGRRGHYQKEGEHHGRQGERRRSSSSSSSKRPTSDYDDDNNNDVQELNEDGDNDLGDTSLKRSKNIILELNNEEILVEKISNLTSHESNQKEFSVSMALLTKNKGHKFVVLKEFSFDRYTKRKKNKRRNKKKECTQRFFSTTNPQFGACLQELQAISKLSHPNIIFPIGLFPMERCLLYIESFIVGLSLGTFLVQKLPVALETLRLYAKGVIQALQFMHQRNFVHRDLRASSIFVDQNALIKVTDFCFDKKLKDCIHAFAEENSTLSAEEDCKNNSDGKDVKLTYPLAPGRGGKKSDIHRFGIIMLSLAQGRMATEQDLKTGTLSKLSRHFLKQALTVDERERWSADQLLAHPWILGENIEDEDSDYDDEHYKRRRQRSLHHKGDQDDFGEMHVEEHGIEDESVSVPFLASLSTSNASRLENEFSFMEKIGQGGFGLVMKVRNKLDGQVYAIKKITLSQNQLATKKLVREVKLLSRLNHENVVRYYTSWIEIITKEINKDDTDEVDDDRDEIDSSAKNIDSFKESAKNFDNVIGSVSFTSRVVASSDDFDLDIDDLETSDDDESTSSSSSSSPMPSSTTKEDSSSHIVFDRDDDHDESVDVVDAIRLTRPKSKLVSETRVMYIQMELCDRQTLRTAIDEERLNEHPRRMWRLFREILEGLNHIHTQGMIHRDLKPMNIFLDRDDHVKIGDFGLATTNSKVVIAVATNHENDPSYSDDEDDDRKRTKDLTGQIGTALYVAPEINVARVVNYTQKVDVYSLGVIFFEMSYPPLTTGMERIMVINGIRSQEIKLPEDYQEGDPSSMGSNLLRRLLDHDPARRPNTQELLQSDLLPPPQVEEASVHEMLKHTMSNTKSSVYRHLVDACLSQKTTLADDISFDIEHIRSWTRTKNLSQTLVSDAHVREVVEEVFKRHGALPLKTPFLAPIEDTDNEKKSNVKSDDNTVKVMSRAGMVVSMPYDLRHAFARFLARARVETPLKRYTIAPVFRELKVFGFHPREHEECAMDVVHSRLSLMADAEVLAMCDSIISSLFNSVSSFTLRLNHASLVQGVISGCCGLDGDDVYEVVDILVECNDRSERQTRLSQLGKLSDTALSSLLNALDHEGSIEHVSGLLRHLTRRPGPSGSQIKKSLKQLEQIVKHVGDMNMKLTYVIAPSMVCYNPKEYSGLIFQLVRNKRHRVKTKSFEVIASGGRYDALVESFGHRLNLERRSNQLFPHAVGVSFNLERLTQTVMASKRKKRSGVKGVDVIVHVSDDSQNLLTPTSKLLSELWSKKIRALLVQGKPIDEVHHLASQLSVSIVVDVGMADKSVVGRLLFIDGHNERAHHEVKKLFIDDICPFVLKHMEGESENDKRNSCNNTNGDSVVLNTNTSSGSGTVASSVTVQSGRVVSHSENMGGSLAHVNYHMRFLDKAKYHASLRKRLESTISAKISQTLQHFASSAVVEVFALQLPLAVLRSMKTVLNFDEDENIFEKSVQTLTEKHPRHRKVFNTLCDTLQQCRFKSGRQIFILYSVEQHAFTVIMTA